MAEKLGASFRDVDAAREGEEFAERMRDGVPMIVFSLNGNQIMVDFHNVYDNCVVTASRILNNVGVVDLIGNILSVGKREKRFP